ncbi:ras-related protein Rab-8A-like isoform X2 [Dysidea avara]|uniref:ras-related protein Rab-8A-like isoform X2 n=1 Tax=Dysidea avara TaxID=196820 RepID=UPI003327C26F
MADAGYDYLIKLTLVGAAQVGKSCLLLRYVEDCFSPAYIATIGVDFRLKTIELNEKIVKLQIWDTAGQERFQAISNAYYRGSAGVMMVYDITDEATFNHIGKLINEVKEAAPDAKLMVVGNKCDLENVRVVSTEQGQSFADEHGCKFMETSASDNVNVDEMITEMAQASLEN